MGLFVPAILGFIGGAFAIGAIMLFIISFIATMIGFTLGGIMFFLNGGIKRVKIMHVKWYLMHASHTK